MRLYERDYKIIISDIESDALKAQIEFDERKGLKKAGASPKFTHPDNDVRMFLWQHNSDFSNHLLCHLELRRLNLDSEANDFHDIIDSDGNETFIKSYIKNSKKWFIPGTIFNEYSFGHHVAYLFPEQQLGE
jgi:hypothetical protein